MNHVDGRGIDLELTGNFAHGESLGNVELESLKVTGIDALSQILQGGLQYLVFPFLLPYGVRRREGRIAA